MAQLRVATRPTEGTLSNSRKPPVRYATTRDGVGIAYWAFGEGPPLVLMPTLPISHLEMEWEDPHWQSWAQWLASRHTVVRYDNRGSGLSDRSATDFSIEAQSLDLEAVVDALGLERFALFAQAFAGPVAISYAVHHPERVTHLILWHSFSDGTEYTKTPHVKGIYALVDDWELFLKAMAYTRMGWTDDQQARRFADLTREAVSPETIKIAFPQLERYEVTGLLARVQAPTLVLHRREYTGASIDTSRSLAREIPRACLTLLDGEAKVPFVGDVSTTLAVLAEFLEEPTPGPGGPPLTESLSAREIQVIRLIAIGMSNKQIADRLMVSTSTVKTHVNSILGKLRATNRTHAVAIARQVGLLKG